MFRRFKKWIKSGVGELIGFTFSAITITSIFIMILGAFILHDSWQYMNAVSRQLARDIIVCKDIDEAKEKAQENVEAYIKAKPAISDVQADVYYVLGTEEEKWKKGNFINIHLTYTVNSISPFTTGRYDSIVMMMIERTEETRYEDF